jgi:hypothetical protein
LRTFFGAFVLGVPYEEQNAPKKGQNLKKHMTTTAKQLPAKTITLANLKAAIWRNSNEKGPKFSATFERIYKDGEDQWKSSHSYTRDDVLVLAKLADWVFTWIATEGKNAE